MNIPILIAVVVQAVVSRVSRVAGAVVGFFITTGILLWGLSVYSGGGAITFFGATLSQPVFIIACLVWYALDVWALLQARKYQAFQRDLAASPAADGAGVSPGVAQTVTGTERTIPLVVSWQGAGMATDVDVYVTLDGAPVGSGSFIRGFVLNLMTTEGVHEVGVKAAFRRSKVTLTTQRNKRYRVDLKYSRMSGKFTLESSEADEQRQPAAVA